MNKFKFLALICLIYNSNVYSIITIPMCNYCIGLNNDYNKLKQKNIILKEQIQNLKKNIQELIIENAKLQQQVLSLEYCKNEDNY